jgi:epoxyqueuosine reductase QueG
MAFSPGKGQREMEMKDGDFPVDYTAKMKEKAKGWGADLVGVADVGKLSGLRTDPADLLDPFRRAVSVAVRIPIAVFDQITDRPTPVYVSVYQTANRLLDEIALRLSIALQADGFKCLPIPASQILDEEHFYAALSHKAVARMAGLGWQGKSLLLVTPRSGPRVRLVTVLTDAPLRVDRPMKNRCGGCTQCQDVCPVHAIKGTTTLDHYKSRQEAVFLERCAGKVVEDFGKDPRIGFSICGICIKACPFGSQESRRRGPGFDEDTP